jgi:putative membrane protein
VFRVPAQLVRGFLMGAADLVPGVSGGTIALVLGIYERLIANIRTAAGSLGHLVRLDVSGAGQRLKKVEWAFLVPLLGGIVLAVFSLAGILDRLLTEQPEIMSAVFFGLVVGSVLVAWEALSKRDRPRMVVLVAVAAAAAWALGLRGEDITDPGLLTVLGAGSLAICAMILPGISGSFILVMLGLYEYILDAVHQRDLPVVAVFATGAVVGLALFSTVLNWMLRRHHDTVVAALIGLMLGSLRVLWPWPAGADGIDETHLGAPESATLAGAVLGALAAFVAVVGIAGMSRRKEKAGARS